MPNTESPSTAQLLTQLNAMISEGRNPDTLNIDQLSTLAILQSINREDQKVPSAVQACLVDIAAAVDVIVNRMLHDGRLIYIGAGTSGRLGILDAVECRPTFSVPEHWVQGIIAGGEVAIQHAVEGAEDDREAAREDLTAITLTANDIVVGLTASGRTPYVDEGLKLANELGAATVAITCNPDSEVSKQAQISICPVVGPEVLTGSTRMKSGTAQKLILNMLSTAAMIKLGKTYQNLMVDVNASNQKLKARAVRIVMQATDCTAEIAERSLTQARGNAKLAILMLLTNTDVATAEQLLAANQGHLRRAVETNAKS